MINDSDFLMCLLNLFIFG